MQENVTLRHDVTGFCGFHFLNAGLWYFIIGIFFGFGVLIHYLAGSNYNLSTDFLSNITLWFGSPLSLSVSYLQIGGLGMGIVGAAGLFFHTHDAACSTTASPTEYSKKKKNSSLLLCHIGLILLFITGYIGYFILDGISPGFYYIPLSGMKNLWLILQGISILIYLIGIIIAACCLCKCKKCYTENPDKRAL